MNIYEKLLKITEELGFVAKNLSVGNQYKAVGEGDVLAAVKPLEIKYGVYSYPLNREIVFQDVLEEDKGTYTKTTFFMRVKTTYRFVNVNETTEFVDIDTFGDGVDSLDKAPGKAMTYADKYALLKAYKIQTGDDPDQHHSDKVKVSKPKPYVAPKTSNNYKDDAQAKQEETAKGLALIMGGLNKEENKAHRPVVISQICNERKVDKWSDITFDNDFTYQKLLDKVKTILNREKGVK